MSFSGVFPEAHAQGSLCPAPKGAVGEIGVGMAVGTGGSADFPTWVIFSARFYRRVPAACLLTNFAQCLRIFIPHVNVRFGFVALSGYVMFSM